MKHYLLNHQPQKGLQAACAQQGQAPTCNARGKGHTSASPKTLTKIILVLLTMILLPSAAWGQITVGGHSPSEGNISGENITQGTVTFKTEEETSILTLNNAIINGNIEYSGTYPLEIKLVGSVTMNCGSSSKAFVSTNEVSLSFSTNSTDNGSLTISDYPSYNFDASDISTFSSKFTQISCSEGSGLVAVSQDLGTIYVSKSYYITVGGVPVTTDNENGITDGNINIKGTGTVKYVHDAETNSGTLLLTGVTITRSEASAIIIPTSLRKLAINIQGVNTINTTDNYPVITSNRIDGKGTVEFSGTGSLTLKRGADYGITSFLTVDKNSYKDGLVPTYKEPATATSFAAAKEVLISTISYNLTVAGVEVTSANYGDILDGDNKGKVSFTPATLGADQASTPATLTLNGATINGDIVWDGSASAPLTIEIAGMNTVINNAGDNDAVSAIRAESATSATTCPLTIAKKDDAESATLKLAGYNNKGGNADAFTNFNLSTGLNNASVTSKGITYYYYTSEPTYDLTVAGIQVHGISGELGYRENVLQDGTVSFTPANEANNTPATLTLNGASLTAGIVTGMNMTIDLKGNNSITVNSGYALSVPNNESPTITFTSSSSPIGNLTLKSTASAFSGLVGDNINILYDTSKEIEPSFLVTTAADPTTADFKNSTEAVITNGTAYGLYIADVPVTSSNASGITGSGIKGTVTYTDATKTLTLNGAEITGNISSSINQLKVYLIGENSITPANGSTPFAYTGAVGTTSPQLSFESSDTDEGELTMNGVQELSFGRYSTEEFSNETTVYHQWMKKSYENTQNIYYNPKYGIKVGGYETSKANKDNITAMSGDYQISYSPEDNALKIPATTETFASTSIVSSRASLNIIISGTSKIGSISFEAAGDVTSGKLTIKRDTQSETNTITLENNGGVIKGFSEVTIEAPLHITEPEGFTGWTNAVTSAEISDWTWSGVEEIFKENNTYATYYNPEADMYLPSGYTPYVITGVSGSSVTTQALSYIPKGAMVLIAKSENTATTAVTTGNKLKYADSDNPVTATETSNYYVLYNGKFVKVTRGTTIGGPDSGSGCYLDLSGVTVAGTRGFYDIDGSDGTTAIKDVKSGEVDGEKWADGGWHDLQGRRLSAKPTKPGLYILNGKKVVIK